MSHKGWHSRHYLPHFDSQDVTQFVTFRLADSLSAEARARLKDAELRSEPIARLVEDAFLAFDGTRYRLHAWTVMPNHVHVLFSAMPNVALGSVVGSWKRFTARKANELLGRSGEFWQTEYWDRFIRNQEHFAATEEYIDQNPVKAGLVTEARLWPYGSARLKMAETRHSSSGASSSHKS